MEFEKLRGIIADVMSISEEEISMQSTFLEDLGADSLDVFEIVMRIEAEFGIEIPTEAIENIVTVEDAVTQIQQAK